MELIIDSTAVETIKLLLYKEAPLLLEKVNFYDDSTL